MQSRRRSGQAKLILVFGGAGVKISILDYLEDNLNERQDKVAFRDESREISYKNFINRAKQVASYFLEREIRNMPVAIYLDKTVSCLEAMFGCVYSSNIYCVLDVHSPKNRINMILDTLKPKVLLTECQYLQDVEGIEYRGIMIIQLDEIKSSLSVKKLSECRRKIIDQDPVYILFTSGSTGIPKGTVVCHRSVINYIESVISIFCLNDTTNFGSQTPFYFSMSVLDIYTNIFVGGTFTIIPKLLFAFPVKLIAYLNEYRINTIYWVPTAMNIVANRKTFSVIKPEYLRCILFAGEVMPVKQLNYWMDNLPQLVYANLYGPTEITDTGTYYIVNRKFENNESLPIGIPFPNSDVILLTDENQLADDEGEICFRGSFLGAGYFNNWEKSQEVFCQNPLNTAFSERIYRTGDIGKYNKRGELLYISRKDFQIKKSGYRIELGEIESNALSIEEIKDCVCVYDDVNSKIVMYYTGNISESSLVSMMHGKIAKYMYPDKYVKKKSLPINANGKYDRIKLLEDYKNGDINK